MEEESDTSAEVWGALLIMAMIGSCANMPYLQGKKEPEKIPPKIEQRQKIATNQAQRVSCPYIVRTR